MMNQNDQALAEWRQILPPDAAVTGERLSRYAVNCLGLSRNIIAALLPANEEEVIQIVRVAARYKIPLYTFSIGHNWGYGSALPVVDNCVIVDLSRMNKILDMDTELGVVTLEPGVTQQQLFDYLRECKQNYFVPTTGAGPSGSLIGNALERGWGMTPERDHFTAIHSLRAVLPDGRLYQSYMSEVGAPKADAVYKWGIGPYVDGLFSQGNIGIVTSMQIALVRRPEHIEVFVFTLKDAARFPRLAEHCRELLADLKGPVTSIKFINQHQVKLVTGSSQLGAGLSADYAWMAFGVIHCRRSMIGAVRKGVRRALGPVATRLIFLNHTRLRLLKTLYRCLPGPLHRALTQPIERIQELIRIVNGEPGELELRLVYRHVPFDLTRSPINPVRDGIGIIWYAPVIPLKTAIVERMVAMIENTLARYGFDQALSMTTLSEKCAMGVIPILFKKPEGAAAAHQCFQELWAKGLEIGCFPYRMNVEGMAQLTEETPSIYWDLVQTIKSAIDPDQILSPGRYSPMNRKVER